jgi:hypothetical protein
MSITRETLIVRADMNDEFGVTVEQAQRQVDYTLPEARELAAEILRAVVEAERVTREDRDAAWISEGERPVGLQFDRLPDSRNERDA